MAPASPNRNQSVHHKIQRLVTLAELLAAAVFALTAILYRGVLFSQAGWRAAAPAVLVWVLCLAAILLKPRLSPRLWRALSILYALASPLYIVLSMELVITAPVSGSLLRYLFGNIVTSPKMLGLNVLLVAMLVLLFTGLTSSLSWGPRCAGILGIVFSIVNYYVNEFRGSAVTAADFATIRTAADVVSGYRFELTYRVYMGALLLFFLLMTGAFLREARLWKKGWMHAVSAVTAVVVFALFINGFILSGYLKEHYIHGISYINLIGSYRSRGTAATLARSLPDAIPEKPSDYSPELAASIAARFPSDPEDSASVPSEKKPNIIVVFDETFSDLSLLGDFETSQEVLPFLNSLEENCVRGVSYASVLGGRTANTEFEFLTGSTMGFLPASAVPFQIFVRRQLPSLASMLKQGGYCGLSAFHPWSPGNYNRDKVYPLLGFEDYYYRGNTPLPLEVVRRFSSDESDFQNLFEIYEQTRREDSSPYFFYNMTVQNHSPYDVAYENFPGTVKAQGLKRNYQDVNQYLSLIQVTDEAVEELISYFRQVEEPTVILFTGDHQPNLSNRFYREVVSTYGEDSPESNMVYYQVPFWIWANFDLPEQEGVTTSMNYLQSLLIDSYGGRMTGWQRFLLELHEDVPAINTFGYYGSDGVFYEIGDETSPYYEQVHDYAVLQYNQLFDDAHRVPGFFE